jgi:hypothetical protein
MPQALWNIIWNITGGIIVALLISLYHIVTKSLRCRAFRQVFGRDLEELYVIYPSCESPSREMIYPKPKSQVPRQIFSTTNLTTVNSNAITRSISYLSYAIGTYSKSLPKIRSDIEMDQIMNISFLTVGGLTNYKSLDILEDTSNTLLEFGFVDNVTNIRSRNSKRTIVKDCGVPTDYGLILKIYPSHSPSRTWLCIAGIGEWGTSGAAWWLSRYWKFVRKRAKNKPFACIIRTKIGSDDSSHLIHKIFLSSEEVEETIKETFRSADANSSSPQIL